MSGGSKGLRYVRGDQEEEAVYANVERLQKATGDQVVQRTVLVEVETSSFRACAVCVTVLCVLLAAGIIGVSTYYHSAINDLTLDRDQWKTSYDNMTLERNQWETSYNNTILQRDQLQRELQHEVNQLKGRKFKLCPSGWKRFGCSCYYKSTENITWQANRQRCLDKGADMVIVNDQEEQEFIRGFTAQDKVGLGSWIGLNRTGGKWTWVDGTPQTTTQLWGTSSPRTDADMNCALYWSGVEGWTNAPCTYIARWMCEN